MRAKLAKIAGVRSQDMSTDLRHWRAQRHISQRALAAYLKVAYQTVTAWETGRPMPWAMRLAIRHYDCEHGNAPL
jgi:DNA-binding transcriptional regulator YiaG